MLAVGLAEEFARPLSALRDSLADAVQLLDNHVATAKGPNALSYDDSKSVRETIADAYLKSTTTARLAEELASAVSSPGCLEGCDINALLDDSVLLVRHRFASSTEFFIDHGELPSVSAPRGEVVLAISRILLYCADSTREAGEGAVSLRTRCEGELGRSRIVIAIAENGSGVDELEMAAVSGLAKALTARLGGAFEVASAPDAGATFELRLPVAAK